MNKIQEIKKELEKNLGYNFNNWGKGDLQMLKEIINANDKVVKNLSLCAVVKSFVCPQGCGKNGDMGSCMSCVGK
tara:strand:- start:227 stop:451 length:225 start_codon:yes stop_codon:yes gene_type:complete